MIYKNKSNPFLDTRFNIILFNYIYRLNLLTE